jgi:hypothetical protein
VRSASSSELRHGAGRSAAKIGPHLGGSGDGGGAAMSSGHGHERERHSAAAADLRGRQWRGGARGSRCGCCKRESEDERGGRRQSEASRGGRCVRTRLDGAIGARPPPTAATWQPDGGARRARGQGAGAGAGVGLGPLGCWLGRCPPFL